MDSWAAYLDLFDHVISFNIKYHFYENIIWLKISFIKKHTCNKSVLFYYIYLLFAIPIVSVTQPYVFVFKCHYVSSVLPLLIWGSLLSLKPLAVTSRC